MHLLLKDTEHLFIYLRTIYILFFCESSVDVFCLVYCWNDSIFFLIQRNLLYIKENKYFLCDVLKLSPCFLLCFHHSMVSLIHLELLCLVYIIGSCTFVWMVTLFLSRWLPICSSNVYWMVSIFPLAIWSVFIIFSILPHISVCFLSFPSIPLLCFSVHVLF